MSFNITTWRWIFGTLGVAVFVVGLFVLGPEESVKFSAALAGAGALLGVLVSLVFSKRMDSQVAHLVLFVMTLAVVVLLIVGIVNVRLPDAQQMAYIAMAGAMLSAFGGAAAGRL